MAKIDLTGAGRTFDTATSFLKSAMNDQNDPLTYNFGRAISEYFSSIGAAQVETADALNKLFEQVDRIEAKLRK